MNDYPNPRDCQHGALRRSCRVCELEAEVRELREENAALREVLAELGWLDEWDDATEGTWGHVRGRPVEDTPPL